MGQSARVLAQPRARVFSHPPREVEKALRSRLDWKMRKTMSYEVKAWQDKFIIQAYFVTNSTYQVNDVVDKA